MMILSLRLSSAAPATVQWATTGGQPPPAAASSACGLRRGALFGGALAALAILSSGCAATLPESKPIAAAPESTPIPPSPMTRPAGAVVLTPQALIGRWRKDCGEVIEDGTDEKIYDIVEVTYSADETVTRIQNFSDPACTVAYRYAPSFTASGRYKVGEAVAGINLERVRALDLATQAYAGAAFEPREYLAFAILGDRLYFADEDDDRDGMSATNRALRLDFSRPYLRQP